VYCFRMFYNQPNCCKGLKVCMNGRIFLAGVVMNSVKTVGQKVGGLNDRRAPLSKKMGAWAHEFTPTGWGFLAHQLAYLLAIEVDFLLV